MSPVERELKQRLSELGPDEKRQLLTYARTPGESRCARAGALCTCGYLER